ncbi:probable 3',5'-cyclic phosphodiesterase pde-5 isoform X2 [Clytia hemisphaerica]|uniref:probable 3',5'-cyclic phosphodiesterase pde-5 isoform X2 n=1 Tax=Clytia hemisphaerica TaxID=252671 RepID=UPI0034D51901
MWLNDNLYFKRPKTNSFSYTLNTSCLERQQFMEKFIAEVQQVHGDVRGGILNQLVDCCASGVNATGHNLYLADGEGKRIWKFLPESTKPVNLQIVREGSTIACYVAATKETICTSDIKDERYPEGVGVKDFQSGSVLCQPIISPNGDLMGVMELTRLASMTSFSDTDNQIVNGYLTWGSIVLYYAEMYHSMHKQRRLNEFLLNVTKSIFQDIVSMDTVIMKIMNFAQTLVDADRTSLFLLDNKTDELYARIFDIGTGLETKLQEEIRFPKSKGVAGHVATTGETLNIKNAYDDPRFNRDIDVQTGYKTHTLLCMPIFIRGNLIGVVQMVNKKQGVFTTADEKAFQTFAVYCGLALHHAKLYDKIRRSEQKYKVALEVLSYHSMCTEYEVDTVKNHDLVNTKEQVGAFELNILDLETIEMSRIAIDLFTELFQTDSRFDPEELTRFTLTVRRNYRRVPYHNWSHAFTVAHCMYCVVANSKGLLTGLEAVALYVSCLCHDLDHRGKNNEWMKTESTPLAAVYTTSTLEHHHFNQTITILQHEGHNIFSHLNSSEYKQILGIIKECILATDLAQFFGNKAKLNDIVNKGKFSWENSEHRRMFRALSMTACDLSACAKPWKIQYETVKVIFQEFYAQGDEEKALGRTPVPMMDRDTADKLPNHQVGFLVGICIPGYELLCKLVPGTKPLLDGAKKNFAVWSEMVKKQNEEKEKEKEREKMKQLEEAKKENRDE